MVENLEAEKEDLSKLLNKKTQEIDKLNGESNDCYKHTAYEYVIAYFSLN